jgi:prefoldin subunit 5|tara:strand:+ start:1328 stop:1546 length:219 start_codon:yes stop_codon:yes gene_type:complete
MAILKVQGHSDLIKETRTKAIINKNVSEYNIYMARLKSRNQQSDELRSAVKEINSLKAELREIKDLVKGIAK